MDQKRVNKIYNEMDISGKSTPVRTPSRASSPVKISQLFRPRSLRKTLEQLESTSNYNHVTQENTDGAWYITCSPRNIDEVALHKRKLADVKEAFLSMLQSNSSMQRPRILLLTGPSGCSKSTVIKLLAEQYIPNIRKEYLTAGPYNYSTTDNRKVINEYNNNSDLIGQSHMDSFAEYLRHAKYLTGRNLSLMLVEDLPNVSHKETRREFQKLLLQWLYSPEALLPPLIICLTECELKPENDNKNFNYIGTDYLFTAETVLGQQILSHPLLKRIKFNPINATLMKKHLNIVSHMNAGTLRNNGKWNDVSGYIGDVAKNTGDIRSGISNLQFWACSSSNNKISFLRENNVSYFHAIGKVIYGSREFDNDNDMINNLIASNTGTIFNDNFKLGLFENYVTYNKGDIPLTTALSITDTFSQNDKLAYLPESLEYLIRSVRDKLGAVKSGDGLLHGKTYFPREGKIRKLQHVFNFSMDDYNLINFKKYQSYEQYKTIKLLMGYYGPYIRKKRNYKKKSLKYFLDSMEKNSSEYKAIINQNLETFMVNEDIDILERIGGELKTVETELELAGGDDEEREELTSINRLQQERQTKMALLQKEEDQSNEIDTFGGDEILNTNFGFEENIEDSSDNETENIELDDDADNSLIEFLSQQPPKVVERSQDKIDDNLSDSDLDDL